jgi:hypothetical protein
MSMVFVTAGAVSITIRLGEGCTPEVGAMGREGLLGYQLLLGAQSLAGSHLMHGEGAGVIVSRRDLQKLFAEDAEFRTRVLELALVQNSVLCRGNWRHAAWRTKLSNEFRDGCFPSLIFSALQQFRSSRKLSVSCSEFVELLFRSSIRSLNERA